MLSTALVAVLAIGLASPPIPDDPMLIHEIPVSGVAAVNFGHFLPLGGPDDSLDVFIMLKGGGSLLISGGFYSLDGGNFCVFQTDYGSEPVVLSTTWADDQSNVHTVTTDCDKFPSLEDCVTAHQAALKIMSRIFPKSLADLYPLPGKVRIDGEDGR